MARPVHTESSTRRWPIERILFALAGTMTLLSVLLAVTVSSWFLLLTAFVGANQWLYVTVGNCPASLVLRRFGAQTSAKCSS
jgi:hypothetical protein